MKKVSRIFIALMVTVALSVSGCRETKKEESHDEHGHTHEEGADHSHEHEEVKQEEFTVEQDSINPEEGPHTHDNGETHHDHD